MALILAHLSCLLLASLSVSAAVATNPPLDYCHSEPKVHIYTSNATTQGSRVLLIHVPKLHGNPYHALHDTAWAVSHYMHNCLGKPFWPQPWPPRRVHLYMHVNFDTELSRCAREPEEYNRWKQPQWGPCMLRAVALELGIPKANIIASSTFSEKLAFSDEVKFASRYRVMNYGAKPWRNRRFVAKKRSRRTKIPDDIKMRALTQFVQSAYNAYLPPLLGPLGIPVRALHVRPSKVRVLIYDRKDKHPYKLRRKWANPEPLVAYLKTHSQVSVTHLSEMPKSLGAQAALFRDTDVAILPHGAASANTIFMTPGADIVEIWKCCKEEVRDDPTSPRPWTGWHADLLGLHLHYLQCHHPDGFASRTQLRQMMERGELTEDRWCQLPAFQVDGREAVAMVEPALQRQMLRVSRLRRESGRKMMVALVCAMAANTFILACCKRSVKRIYART